VDFSPPTFSRFNVFKKNLPLDASSNRSGRAALPKINEKSKTGSGADGARPRFVLTKSAE
jgi:hypothetical protein